MDSIVLSKKISVSSDSKKTQLNNNICAFGCTGSGKTCSFIEPLILKNFTTNQIIYDPKRELHDKYRPLYESRGATVYELNLSEPEKSDVAFDPLAYISSDEDISVLANAIVNLTPQRTNSVADRYWEDSSVVLAKFGLYYVLTTKKDANFADFIDFILKEIHIEDGYGLIKTSIDHQIEKIRQQNVNHPLIELYNTFKVLPIKTAGCIFSTLRTTLTTVFSPSLKAMFRTKKTFDLNKFAHEQSRLFITANGANSYLNSFVNMVFDLCHNELTKIADKSPNQTLPIPVNLVMEDFACCGGSIIKAFPEYIAKFRSKGLSCALILQDENQLSTMYGEYGARTIMSNSDTILYLGGNDLHTAKNMAERLNVPLEKVLYMALGDIIVLRRGSYPVIDKRYPIFEDKEYKRAVLLAKKKRNEQAHTSDEPVALDSNSHFGKLIEITE